MGLMKRLLLLFLLFPALCLAGSHSVQVVVGQTSGSSTYLIEESFDGETYTTPTNWTDNGTPDYSVDGEVTLDYNDYTISPAFTAQSAPYMAFKFTTGSALDNPATMRILGIRASSTTVSYLAITTDNRLRGYHGSAFIESTPSFSVSTTYFVWVTYEKAASGDGTMSIRVGTTGTYSSATEWVSVTAGTATDDITNVYISQISSDSTQDLVFYDVIVDDEAIGDF